MLFNYFLNERRRAEEYADFELCPSGTLLKEGGRPTCSGCPKETECDGGYSEPYPKKVKIRKKNLYF